MTYHDHQQPLIARRFQYCHQHHLLHFQLQVELYKTHYRKPFTTGIGKVEKIDTLATATIQRLTMRHAVASQIT